jgi:hypothetical protein
MIYEFSCEGCGEVEEFTAPVALFETLRQGAYCIDCQRPAVLIVSGGRTSFMKSPFPKGFNEHISDNGHYLRDKVEAREVAAENGWTSKLVENMM